MAYPEEGLSPVASGKRDEEEERSQPSWTGKTSHRKEAGERTIPVGIPGPVGCPTSAEAPSADRGGGRKARLHPAKGLGCRDGSGTDYPGRPTQNLPCRKQAPTPPPQGKRTPRSICGICRNQAAVSRERHSCPRRPLPFRSRG